MKTDLKFKNQLYELNLPNEKIIFNLNQINYIKIRKNFRIKSIITFILFITILFAFFIYHNVPFLISLGITILLLLIFFEFIHKYIYIIKIIILNKLYIINTKDEELILDFIMLEHFYRTEIID